jgi:hypothetical protein
MAQTPYSTKLLQAYSNIDPQKRVVATLAKDAKKKTQYAAAVKQLAAYQKAYDDLKEQEQKWRDEQETKKKTTKGTAKQADLDIALATGDQAKADRIAADMAALGVQPKGIDGKPLTGFTATPQTGATAEIRYGLNGESLVPGTSAYENGSTVKPSVTSSSSTSNTTGNTGGKGGTGSKTPSADAIKTAWVGYLESTFKTLPKEYKTQIDKLFTTAKAENWTEGTFTEALKQTSWWQSTLPSLRSFFIETHDPRNAAVFAEKLSLNTANVAASLEKLGIRAQQVDPVTGKVVDNAATIQGIAMDAIKNGWNDTQILQHLGDNAQLLFTGGGTIGSSVDNIKKQALNYGIAIDKNYLDTIQRSLLDPTDGRDQQYYLNEMKAQAMDLYKPFASSIKEGRSLYEVTNSYRNQMATLLEVDSTNLTWKDLMAKVVDPTTGNARTFADFNKQVKQDPLWQYTKNAKETYSNTALDLMKQFGFMG